MKQLVHICMSMLLVMATMGVTLHQHYCGDELQNTGLEKYSGCCSDEGTDAGKNGCCENSTTEFRADGEFQQAHFSAPIALLPAALPQLFLSFAQSLQLEQAHTTPLPLFAEAPPLYGSPYLASLCTLLI
ncbi:HYC_CC_PP family protein [Cesiribacter andamanensis]|uniref:Uncharacterized protein n=1 Tax=Cesiribacter andamanensis AMV16 TaxID=1279009 RepID=M7N614_9BACT|nr:hypothetical protein [Cesiribacter andamanensis]EMR02717.1 hypothetical protein ADICEAN_02134 [Cesiribacter andamanensis AMV16]